MRDIHPYYGIKKSSEVVLLDFIDWSITLREAIFSLFLIGLMIFIGFLISSKIEEHVNNDTLRYRQAVEISSSEFHHGLKTGIGDVFVNGELEAINPVSYNHIDGEYLSIDIEKQEYRRHTEHYTTTDRKGRVHHHVRHYWTWDTVGYVNKHVDKVKYCGVEFPYGQFNYGGIDADVETYKSNILSHYREIIYTRPIKFNATMFGNLKVNEIEGNPLLTSITSKKYREKLTTSHFVSGFWFFWIVFIVFVVIGFFVIDNGWLEDK